MKYIKSYESLAHTTKIGNYVIVESESIFTNVKEFINNSIGKIVDIVSNVSTPLKVKYINIPKGIKHYFDNTRSFYIKQIKYISTNREDLKPFLIANKYNI